MITHIDKLASTFHQEARLFTRNFGKKSVSAVRLLVVGLSLLFLQACQSASQDTSTLVAGQWSTSLGGFPVTVTYSESSLVVQGHKAVGYTLEDDVLRIESGGSQAHIVTFEGPDVMIQTDTLTGTRRVYNRI